MRVGNGGIGCEELSEAYGERRPRRNKPYSTVGIARNQRWIIKINRKLTDKYMCEAACAFDCPP
jgi:ribosomal protein S19E (S16A)